METTNQSSSDQFSQRKKDHIDISLKDESQAYVDQFSRLQFQHQALPEIDFDEISLDCEVFGHPLSSPLFVSSMTLGHEGSAGLNQTILEACQEKNWMMGVGSQRRQLFDSAARKECEDIRKKFPKLVVFGNIGLSQVISSPSDSIADLVDSLGAQFLVVHTNPLQEAIQPEGTPQFQGGIEALERLIEALPVPVVLKETGCGFSQTSFAKLKNISLAAIDVSGMGGTHWGRVEGLRMPESSLGFKVAQSFSHWGISTVDSLENGLKSDVKTPLWASGGVRSGVDAAKLLALGAEKVGFAKPILQAAVEGREVLISKMEQLDQELKVALFCLGAKNLESLIGKRTLLKWI